MFRLSPNDPIIIDDDGGRQSFGQDDRLNDCRNPMLSFKLALYGKIESTYEPH
jgi:hypothetical protein